MRTTPIAVAQIRALRAHSESRLRRSQDEAGSQKARAEGVLVVKFDGQIVLSDLVAVAAKHSVTGDQHCRGRIGAFDQANNSSI